MARRTMEESEETKEQLISIATQEICRAGYEGLSLVELGKKAGWTRGAVYHHFGSKLGLFKEIVHRLSQEMGEKIQDWALSGPSQGKDPWEALLLGTRGFLQESQTEPYQRIILTEAPAVFGMEDWQKMDDENTTSTLEEAFQELGKKAQATVLAQAFSGAMNQLSRWIQSDTDMEQAIGVLESMFVQSIQ
jgi:AcrR family transcriptional regulator